MADIQTQNLTLMFVDIPTIGGIREQRGEAEARDCQQRCLSLLADIRKQYAGNLVRSIGGTLLCSFVDAGDAVDAAVGMQAAVVSSGLADSGVQIRMGLHCGPVHVRAGNYSGEVVTMAARMVTLAKPQCIVATGDVLEQAGERVAGRFTPLVGEAAERLNLDLYEVAWRQDGPPAGEGEATGYPPDSPLSKRKTASSRLRPRATVSGLQIRKVVALREVNAPASETGTPKAPGSPPGTPATVAPTPAPAPAPAPAPTPGQIPAPAPAPTPGQVPAPAPMAQGGPGPGGSRPPSTAASLRANRLCLIWREKILTVDTQTAVTMGRDPGNDVVLQVGTASRYHADVRCRDGQFFLTDRSANGTFVYDEKGEESFIHQREARLAESGAICPGCPQDEAGCEALLYWMAD